MSGLLVEIQRRAAELAIPLSVHADVTWRCNEDCVHCYCDHSAPELTTIEWKRVIDELAGLGTLFLAISGGEPFVRSDILELLAHARRRNFHLTLKTNATLITDRVAERLARLSLARLQITIFSMRPEVHDHITRRPGSLELSVHAARKLRSLGVPVHIICIMMQSNRREYPAVQAFAQDIGAVFKCDPTITPRFDGDRSLLDLAISQSDLKQVLNDPQMAGDIDDSCLEPQSPPPDLLDGFLCSAGHTLAYIGCGGGVFPCVQFPARAGNVKNLSFADIWADAPIFRTLRNARYRDLQACSRCKFLRACTRCPGLAYMEGDLFGPSSLDCMRTSVLVGQAVTPPLERCPTT